MEGGSFNPDDLRLLDWQYTIIYTDTSSFKAGDLVFLKSSPEIPMTVTEVFGAYVYTTWQNNGRERQDHGFLPQTILHYSLACFVTGRRKFHLCLN